MGLFGRKKESSRSLADLLKGYELPSFPSVVIDVLALLRDPRSTSSEIATLLNRNPALVLSLFKMVNSAAFGLRRQVTDVLQAITLLGKERVEPLVLLQAVRSAQPPISVAWFNPHQFWHLSAQRALFARHIAQKHSPATATEVFTAGILQDMGIPIIVATQTETYAKVFALAQAEQRSPYYFEKELLTFDHQQVGKLMAEQWNLPTALGDAISGHHENDSVHPTIRLVSGLDQTPATVQELIFRCGEAYQMEQEAVADLLERSSEEARSFVA